jgi:hypothetical protein
VMKTEMGQGHCTCAALTVQKHAAAVDAAGCVACRPRALA